MSTVSKKLFVKVAAEFSAEFDVFSVENPNFNRGRFLTACGMEN